jgi:hypothetical protein
MNSKRNVKGKITPLVRPDIAAAIRGGDPRQPMDDEIELDLATMEQAVFWTSVYSEILAMEKDVLGRVHMLMARQSPRVRLEVELSNVPVITAQLARFQVRHDAWRARVRELREPAV